MNNKIKCEDLRKELIDFLVKYLKNEPYMAEAVVDNYILTNKSIKD